MKKEEIIYGRCSGILREITIKEVRKTIKERFGKNTDSWNDFWMTIKLLFPKRIKLYERPYQLLVVVDYDKEGESEEESLKMMLGYIDHLTIVKCIAVRTDEGEIVFIAP